MSDQPRPLTLENFPPGLRRRLRIMAAQRGTTMRQLVIDQATAACDQHEADLEAARERTMARGVAS